MAVMTSSLAYSSVTMQRVSLSLLGHKSGLVLVRQGHSCLPALK